MLIVKKRIKTVPFWKEKSKFIWKNNWKTKWKKAGTTAIGNGVAIPHTKIVGLKKTQVLFIKLKSKIDFSASDEKFVDIIFSIITPETSESEHLLILSSISKFLKKKGCVDHLRKLSSAEEIYKLFKAA